MKLTESTLRKIIKEELQQIVKEGGRGYFDPGNIDTTFHKKHVGKTASGKARSPAVTQQLSDMLTQVQQDIETMKTNPPSDKAEWSELRNKIIDTLERMQLVGRY
jgi:hypothetical protein